MTIFLEFGGYLKTNKLRLVGERKEYIPKVTKLALRNGNVSLELANVHAIFSCYLQTYLDYKY